MQTTPKRFGKIYLPSTIQKVNVSWTPRYEGQEENVAPTAGHANPQTVLLATPTTALPSKKSVKDVPSSYAWEHDYSP